MAQKNEVVEVEQKEITLFERLFATNVNEHTEKKNGLTYLSWAWGWAEVKKVDPNASYKIHEFPMLNSSKTDIIPGIVVPYLETKTGYYVTVSVTINDHTQTETLPVMDERNAPLGTEMMMWSKTNKGQKEAVKTATPTSFEINKSHKRCLVKAIALHGLGLYVYAGEDLPEEAQKEQEEQKQQPKKQPEKKQQENKKDVTKAEDLPNFKPQISEKTVSLLSVFDQEVASKLGKNPMEPIQLLVKNPDFTAEDLNTLTEEQGGKLVIHLENWIKKLQGEEGKK